MQSKHGMMSLLIQVLGKGRQGNREFEVILIYIVSLSTAWATQVPASRKEDIKMHLSMETNV